MDFNKEICFSYPDPSSWDAVYVVFWFLYILPISFRVILQALVQLLWLFHEI